MRDRKQHGGRLLRRRLHRAAAPRGAVGAAREHGLRLGRPRAALRYRPQDPRAAGPGPRPRRGRARRPRGRAVVHDLGHPGGAPRGARRAQGAPPDRAAPRRQRRGALQRPARRGDARARRRRGHGRRRRPGGARRPGGVRRRTASRHRARLPPVGQPRGRHRPARGGGRRGVPRGRGAAVRRRRAVPRPGRRPGRLVVPGRQRPQVGRPRRGRRAGDPQGRPVALAAAGRRAGAAPRPGVRERSRHCGRGRGAGGVPCGHGRGRAAHLRARGPHPRGGPADRPRRRGGRRPRPPPAAHGDVLVPLRGGRGAADRTRPAGFRGFLRQLLHGGYAASQSRAGGDGSDHPWERPGIAAARRPLGGRRPVPRRASRRGRPPAGCDDERPRDGRRLRDGEHDARDGEHRRDGRRSRP